jgi:uncharacterized protein YecT (DUF1311 family)
MQRLPAALFGVAVLIFAGVADAQASLKTIQSRYTPGYHRCMSSPDGASTVGMIDCIDAEIKIHDRRLNAAYAKAQRELTPDERKTLQAAQRAWVAFRDADCAARVDPEQWGSLSRINGNLCLLNRTIERTIELEAFPPNEVEQ